LAAGIKRIVTTPLGWLVAIISPRIHALQRETLAHKAELLKAELDDMTSQRDIGLAQIQVLQIQVEDLLQWRVTELQRKKAEARIAKARGEGPPTDDNLTRLIS